MRGRKDKDREPEVVHVVAAHDGISPRYLSENTNLVKAEIEATYHAYDNPDTVISVESYIDYPVELIKNQRK